MSDYFQQVGLATVHDDEGNLIPNIPLYIRITERGKYGVSPSQEKAIHRISEIVIRHYEREFNEYIRKKNKIK